MQEVQRNMDSTRAISNIIVYLFDILNEHAFTHSLLKKLEHSMLKIWQILRNIMRMICRDKNQVLLSH
jgi:hypothetical protein